MSPIRFDSLHSALDRLEEGFAEADAHPDLLIARDGVIQRFEIAMDLSWKLLQKALRASFDTEERELLTKKDIFRQGARFGLLDDPEVWFGHYEARNRTSHQYDSAEAERTYQRARAFLGDARALLAKLDAIA
jgi:nucleotidyltransferase substrate binding protein (TIGR01987 family)